MSRSSLLNGLRSSLERLVRLAPDRLLVEQFVLTHGKAFTAATLPRGIRRGPARQCFSNAAEFASTDPAYDYAEGFAAAADMPPFLHAWCARDGLALDPTLKEAQRYMYLGVIIPRQTLFATLGKQGHYGILSGSLAAVFMEAWTAARR